MKFMTPHVDHIFACKEVKGEYIKSVSELPEVLQESTDVVEQLSLHVHCWAGIAAITIPNCHPETALKDYAVLHLLNEAKTYAEFDGVSGIQLIGLSDSKKIVTPDEEDTKLRIPGTDRPVYIYRVTEWTCELTGEAITDWAPTNIDAVIDRLLEANNVTLL